jgi:putative nucleotidyltransferase with HDIG domain
MISQAIISENNLKHIHKKLDINKLIEHRMSLAPGNLLRLMELLRDYKTPRGVLIEAVNHDPILVARVLRLANSPIYSFEKEIILIDMALTAIGSQAIYDIVIVEFASRTINNGANHTETFRKIWEHSLAVAILTRKLSQMLEMRGLEESFVCGLLHDFGKFVLLHYDTEKYEEILKTDSEFEMLKAEYENFGYNHTEIGSMVARHWNFPEEICLAILNHHSSSQSEHPRFVEHIIEVADLLANVNGYGVRQENKNKLQSSESVMKLGFSEQFLDNIWESTKDNINEMIRSFG